MKYETPYMDIEILEKEDIVRTSTPETDDPDNGPIIGGETGGWT